jgi:hypothetical protein
MKIDIDKLRAAHAATTQGEWRVKEQRDYQACNSKVECNAGYVVATGYSSPSVKIEYKKLWAEAEGNTNFIALAHNEFPAMLDEIERLGRINYQWNQVFGHLGNTPDECGNAIHAGFDKRDAEIEQLRTESEHRKSEMLRLLELATRRSDVNLKQLGMLVNLRTLLSQATEVFNDTCDCGECGPCKLREEIEGELK